jgi:hypothetical protein
VCASALGDPLAPLVHVSVEEARSAVNTAGVAELDSISLPPESSAMSWLLPLEPQSSADVSTGIDAEGYYRTLYRRFSFSAGAAAYTKFNTNVQVNTPTSVGANIDMEDLLGLDEDNLVARFDARYAFNKRHWLDLSYYDIDRDGSRVISDDIIIGNVTIPAGTTKTNFDTQIIKLAYRYNFVADARTVIGASFGIHLMSLDFGVRSPSFNVEENFRVDAPLPLLGLHGAYALSEKWRLSASAEFLQFDLGDYRGLITDTRLTLDHDTFSNFGWGIGFNGFQADAHLEGNDDLSTDLEYGYQGLMLYLRLFW